MADIKLARGLARAARETAIAQAHQERRARDGLLDRYVGRLARGARLRPGEPATLLASFAEAANGVLLLDHEIEKSLDGNAVAFRRHILTPCEGVIDGRPANRYELVSDAVYGDRRRLVVHGGMGFVSVFEHAYERYLTRDGGAGLDDFRRDFTAGVLPFVLPLGMMAAGQTRRIYAPCGRGLIAGYAHCAPLDEQGASYRIIYDRRATPEWVNPHPLVHDLAGYAIILVFRTFLDADMLLPAQDRCLAALRDFADTHADLLAEGVRHLLITAPDPSRPDFSADSELYAALETKLAATTSALAEILAPISREKQLKAA